MVQLIMLPFVLLGTPLSGPDIPLHQHTLHVESPTFASMPIWVRIECASVSPDNGSSEFQPQPVTIWPSFPFALQWEDSARYDFEVRRNGQPLSPVPSEWLNSRGSMPGPQPPGLSRLPLHLRYKISAPGDYEVRLVALKYGRRAEEFCSEWFPFHAEQPTDEQLETFRRQLETAIPSDPETLVGEYLPSLVANPEPAEFNLLKPHLAIGGGHNCAWNMLNFFPAESIRPTVLALLAEKGPYGALKDHVATRTDLYASDVDEMAATAIQGFVDAPEARIKDVSEFLRILERCYGLAAEHRTKMNDAVRTAITALKKKSALPPEFLSYIAVNKLTEYRPLLREAAENPKLNEQALTCLTCMPDPQDLPRITESILQTGNDTSKPNLSQLVDRMDKAYGEAAIPYLKEIVANAANIHVLRLSALILARHNQPEGYQYLRRALENPTGSKLLESNSQELLMNVETLLKNELPPRKPQPVEPLEAWRKAEQERRNEVIAVLDRKLAELSAISPQQ
ncbi:MAG: hypothetical protein RBU21_22245 [FCB group bacterium]|nr:hypothetical protein [FCB group bacterium]